VDGLRNGPFVAWRAQLQRAMRPPRVVLPGVLRKHSMEVPLTEDQHPIGQFGSDLWVPRTPEPCGVPEVGLDL
jgi:hypothetical protein